MKNKGQLSPDGKWQWNGHTWLPHTPKPISQDGKWQWDGKTWVPYPPPRKSNTSPWLIGSILGGVLVFLIVVAALGAASSSGSGGDKHKTGSKPVAAAPKTTPKPTPTGTPATPAPSSTPSSAPPPAKPAPTPKPQPTLLFSASGTESGESQAFTPPQHYEVQYAWQCDPSEGSGNFIMSTDDQNGQSEWDGVDVDRLAVSGNGTADGYNFGGQHDVHIAVISECNWSINVLAMPS
jgi:hypothetical protein